MYLYYNNFIQSISNRRLGPFFPLTVNLYIPSKKKKKRETFEPMKVPSNF